MTTEADIENAFVDYAESRGCEALKLRVDGQNGFPDRTVLTPVGVMFIEFKRPKGHMSQAQWLWRKVLQALGYEVITAMSLQSAKKVLEDFLNR